MVFQAGFVSLIRTLVIIIAVYYGFRLLFRYLIPFLLGRFIKKQQQKFYDQQGGQSCYSKDKEGTVKVKSKTRSSQKNDELGEYVEYEEIDESK